VLLLQGFLVYLARRMHVYEEETKAHQEARVRLLQRAIDASNEERERIAASIHDGVVQELAGLSFSLGAYAHTRSHDPNGHDQQAILKLVREASETARRATRDLRTLIIEIAPPKLKEQGLGAALEDLLANVGSGPKTELHLDDGLRLDDSTNRLIYRVAQEAVRNSTKYAHAENLSIQVAYDGADVVLRVADDGRGFDAVEQDRQLAEGHVGLGLLQRTVADGGGSLRIASEPGGGTTVEMRAPRAAATDAVP
jgi:two-component system NarL family sensor kinase